MGVRQVVDGVLVSCVEESYDAFPSRETGELVPGGCRRTVWLSAGADAEPIKMRTRDPVLFGQVQAIGAGRPVRANCELYANGKVVGFNLVGLLPALAHKSA